MHEKLLFSPIKIGSMELKNRIVMSPMATNFGTETGDITDQQIAYYVARAKGGVGLIIAESNYVSVEGRAARNRAGMCSDDVIPQHRKLVQAVHACGAKICAQLHHSGAVSAVSGIDQLPVTCSAVNYFSLGEKYVGLIPHELSSEEIRHLVDCYAQAAARVVKCGYDAVLIHAAHGYLVNEFLSPHTNKRTDEYGGSEENRMRFLTEIIAVVRAAVGSDFPIFVRLSSEESVDGGYDFEFIKRVAKKLEELGVNEINCSCGNYEELEKIMPMPHLPDCCYLRYAAELKKHLRIPVSTVGRITTPEMAESILQEGKADLIYVGRAMVADPEWARKAQSGEAIRPCIGCNMGCQERLVIGAPIRCTVNPQVGFDNVPAPAPERSKKILVVGAGPAGIQCALEASRLGHRVTQIEKSSHPGGQLSLAKVPPHKEKVGALMDYCAGALKSSAVNVRLNTPYSPELVSELGAEAVVFATGASEIILRLPGADQPNVFTASKVLSGCVPEGRHGVVIGGGQVGFETAEYLLERGRKITVVEMMDSVLGKMGSVGKKMLLESVMSRGLNVWIKSALKEICPDGVIVERLGRREKLACDFVVMAVGYRPAPVEPGDIKVPYYQIGDCGSVANIFEAVAQGFALARQL
ncbi:MAG: FAD-dependent oxidoreductase [Pyramidobacter sp.]|nr:FAD-dependent oxidoreductase [Pyramidobacter sp.]